MNNSDRPKGFAPFGDPSLKKDTFIRELDCGETDRLLQEMKTGGNVSDSDLFSASEHIRTCDKHK